MDKFIIRKMLESDLDEIIQIEKRVFPDAWEREMFYSEIREHDSKVLIDTSKSKIIGYICGWKIIDEYLINNVAIDLPYRKKGLGQYFLSEIISEQIKQGVTKFFLEVRVTNIGAINLYKKLGFKELRVRKKYYKDPVEDAFEMGAFYGN